MSRERRDILLREMGLGPVWRLRTPLASMEITDAAGETDGEAPASATLPLPRAETANVSARQGASSEVDCSGLAQTSVVMEMNSPGASSIDGAQLGWDDLEDAIRQCRACRLCEARQQAVPGVGDREADWLFVGEGPGAEEDARGEPFVGQAGKLLDAMLAAIDLKRGDNVYIANAVKCRPPNNRTPEPEETAACWPYLQRQIALLKPKLIVALGRPAAQTLLQIEVKIGAARGRLFDYQGIPVIVTYHPAYLLRNLTDKAKAWEDLVFARRTLAQRTSSS